ncbi:DNA replication endonuclease-helicase Dna2 [Knufia fluminis]|uniref:DNA replication ATP-dependent helicase/nuclease n=1 Tax=Knufia fluminis TaxID=191047 RepID=A0AAN8IQN5_9EURO|nr:DNA replication endonuclease-helicase Dna2 [Knufia fluminis]
MPSQPFGSASQSKRKEKTLESAPPKAIFTEEKENAVNGRPTETLQGGNEDVPDPRLLPPQTPGRISLSDLVANPEDLLNQLPSATPHEQITWKHVPGLLNSPSSSVRTSQRGTKRSHSSSPASSQGRRSKHFRPDRDTMDMKSVSQSLQRSPARRSPNHDDPAAVLWSNYAEKRGNEPVLPPLPPFDLFPHTPSGGSKDATFRRTASCGTEWPTSGPKRRKLIHQDPHSTTKQIFASKRKDMLKPQLSKQSKVSILLESVQQSLIARQREQDEPSSSSPLPERFEPQANRAEQTVEDKQQSPSPRKSLPAPPAMRHGSSPLKGKLDKSSDYGDLDFDDDDLEDIEDALTQGQQQLEAKEPAAPPQVPALRHAETIQPSCVGEEQKKPEISAQQDVQNGNRQPQKGALIENNNIKIVDEFDDDDDDLFDEEFQQLAEQVDSQQCPANGTNAMQQKSHALAVTCDGAFDDDCDDNIFDEIDDTTAAVTNNAAASAKQTQSDSRAIKRYLILEVFESKYDISPGRKRPEKMLSIKDEKSKQLYILLLRQSWYETRCVKGSFIHLIGDFNHQGQCVVDDTQNMVIIHPDHLISATVIGDAITCLRRAVLQDRVKATSPPEKPQVYGHILHEVFGEAMKLNSWEWDTFSNIIDQILPSYLESLYEIGVQVVDAKEHLMSKVPLLRAWAEMFVSATFTPDAVIRDRKGTFVPTAINKLLEIEEHVWSPMYGLKGNIDATVQAQIRLPTDNVARTIVAPLELKTGMKDNNEAHRAQTAMYTLLLSDRYDVNVVSGILYYMETSKTFRIEGVRNEIRQMIIWRNLLASYVHDKLELPPMIKKEHLCKRCYAQTSCFSYHKLVEGGDGETSGLKEVFDDAVGHLQPHHQTFFKQWDDLLTKEERDCMKFRRELWTMLSTEREQVGRCFSNVVIEPGSARENLEGPKINRYTYSFLKHKFDAGFAFTESQITVGEPIVISDEKGHFALANGYVTSVRPRRITVAVDRRLQNARKRTKGFNAETNQSFVGIMEVTVDGVPSPSPEEDDSPILYRLDKDEFSNGMATVRNNLIRIMEKDLFKARELRELVVEKKAPSFKHTSTAYSLSGPASQANINVDQRAAIEKVMSAKDYALVLGMPGTGKTTTIAHIIRALVSQGKSVLLTSYTHTAVDNILLKIKDDNIPVLRLGSVGKVHPDVQSFADLSGIPKKSMEELERSWANSKVVATTCLSINHGIFNHRIFDYCIVDEASQITLPVCLGPIRMAHTFILVGDHYQLPPLVQNKEAQEGGLDISLFKLLSDAQPPSVVNLEHQYRMAEDIMLLSNQLIYNGRLKCGTAAVASRTLQIPNLQAALDAHHHRPGGSTQQSQPKPCTPQNINCWLRIALTPSSRCILLNTDTITPTPTEVLTGSNQRITNPTESLLTAQLLTTLIRSGVPPKSIGVITFYRSQLALLRHDVKAIAGSAAAAEVEMHTADKYQGRDKEVILLSCVRSNSARNVGELLKDWRRVNVAITRARSKMVVLGSRGTLEGCGVPVLEGLVKIMADKGWIYDLPAAATEGHAFERSGMTQTQAPSAPLDACARSARALPNSVAVEARKPLQTTNGNANPRAPATYSSGGTKLSASNKVSAPFKAPQPKKVVKGTVDVENVLERRPVLRDIANEMAGGKTGVGSDGPAVMYDLDDFDDDDMLIDF